MSSAKKKKKKTHTQGTSTLTLLCAHVISVISYNHHNVHCAINRLCNQIFCTLIITVSIHSHLKVRAFFHKTVRVCHIYCNLKIGFTCWITVIFGTLKDGSLLINTLASNICLSYRNMFQNGVGALSKIVDAFLSKTSKFYHVRIIR